MQSRLFPMQYKKLKLKLGRFQNAVADFMGLWYNTLQTQMVDSLSFKLKMFWNMSYAKCYLIPRAIMCSVKLYTVLHCAVNHLMFLVSIKWQMKIAEKYFVLCAPFVFRICITKFKKKNQYYILYWYFENSCIPYTPYWVCKYVTVFQISDVCVEIVMHIGQILKSGLAWILDHVWRLVWYTDKCHTVKKTYVNYPTKETLHFCLRSQLKILCMKINIFFDTGMLQ